MIRFAALAALAALAACGPDPEGQVYGGTGYYGGGYYDQSYDGGYYDRGYRHRAYDQPGWAPGQGYGAPAWRGRPEGGHAYRGDPHGGNPASRQFWGLDRGQRPPPQAMPTPRGDGGPSFFGGRRDGQRREQGEN